METTMNSRNKFILITALFFLFITGCDRCLEMDEYRAISQDIKNYVPDSSIKVFTMISSDGFEESFILETWFDTLEAFEPDPCGNVLSWDHMNAMYRSTLDNDNNVEFRLDALNDITLNIGINYKQQIAWNFEEQKITPSGYDNNDYPEANEVLFLDEYQLGDSTYMNVILASFPDDEISSYQIKQVLFASHTGLVWYKYKNGIEFHRK